MAACVGGGGVVVVVVVVVAFAFSRAIARDFVIFGMLRILVVVVVASSAYVKVRRQQTNRAKMSIAGMPQFCFGFLYVFTLYSNLCVLLLKKGCYGNWAKSETGKENLFIYIFLQEDFYILQQLAAYTRRCTDIISDNRFSRLGKYEDRNRNVESLT
ncbi:hypothetical protein FF38_10117 [Lucilia cuprina]|uniref:Uncharacterized protein n=1 Tax=Lucilia cuprina TaxID=7375 RepID=A0A0L0CPA8_LUCCU|nr:hypothetical protein FF38_10117 [Lucilia cuprina]